MRDKEKTAMLVSTARWRGVTVRTMTEMLHIMVVREKIQRRAIALLGNPGASVRRSEQHLWDAGGTEEGVEKDAKHRILVE